MNDGTFTLEQSEALLFEERQARKIKQLREENDALRAEVCRLRLELARLKTPEPEYPLFDRPSNHGVAWGQE